MSRPRNSPDLLSWAPVAVLVLLVAFLFNRHSGASTSQPVAPGTPLPELMVDGWLNVAGDDPGLSPGRPLVVDCWATWCGPCRAEMPHLAKLVEQYRPLGVDFIGLTSETAADLPKIEQFIERVPGFVWPVGYGAGLFGDQLGIEAIPTLIVFDADGKAVWSGHRSSGLGPVLDEMLAR